MLVIEDLGISFGRREVLAGISLRVEAGSIHVILGASGSGKSTLLRAICGLERPTRGTIELAGRVVSRGPRLLVAPHGRDLTMTFQEDALWPHLTVERHLSFGRQSAGRDGVAGAALRDDILRRLGLERRRRERPGRFSGGERQRVGLARALAGLPRLLLLDEPLAHVDLPAQQRLTSVVLDFVREHGITVLWITHRPEEILPHATHASLLSAGRLGSTVPAADAWGIIRGNA